MPAIPTTWTVQCVWGCGAELTLRRKPPAGGVGCDAPGCAAKHNAAATAIDEQRRTARNARRRERRANPPRERRVGDAGGWSAAAPLAAWTGEGDHEIPTRLLAGFEAAEAVLDRAGRAIADYVNAHQPPRTD